MYKVTMYNVQSQKGEIFKRIATKGEEWVLLNNQFHERSL